MIKNTLFLLLDFSSLRMNMNILNGDTIHIFVNDEMLR